ncbi:divalent cation tolerance protein CutA [Mixta theicola]|uniref:Divalent-cation tolerance protein CutA n=1 Tax=Mixta theicola TaxID=1458355 RepID=A0A2K1QB83_9GAMM|nr:divalent cation tolerance protein CutA [Mixta theicola]PNS12277.1 divalent cation tolerance protein CutA [Mixta theicola]GLR08034.1 divalent-cation tolerance protein CutA [Mixta theicola]
MALSTAVIVLCTAPDSSIAEQLANKALSARLAACVTVLPGAISYYVWQGQREAAHEVQMLLKSDVTHQQALIDLLKAEHPYDTPELLVLPVQHGESDYLSWLSASLR